MEFDNISNLVWNALVNSENPQCILASLKQQKLFFLLIDSGYYIKENIVAITNSSIIFLFIFKMIILIYFTFNIDILINE